MGRHPIVMKKDPKSISFVLSVFGFTFVIVFGILRTSSNISIKMFVRTL